MFGKYSIAAWVSVATAALMVACLAVDPVHAYRVCTFRGTVVDHGWRTMTVKSGTQCAEVNVGWRTKYVPNRRPCLGERVAVDFILEEGYMKAVKVVSLAPPPPSVECYPPAPPGTSVCREAPDERPSVEGCVPPKPVYSTRPPAHVARPDWSPEKKPELKRKPAVKKPKAVEKPPVKVPEEEREKRAVAPPEFKTISGEVVASSPKSISLRVMEEGQAAEVVNVRVGLKTKFIPFRRPAVGEKVQVDYRDENGEKFGYTVKVVQ
jgi:hypothetical protein